MSILAISGRKGHGKDVIGQIIQYLIYKNKYKNKIADITLEQFIHFNNTNQLIYSLDWQIKKFADKLKDIICLLIGCSRDQLENESFKSKELGEEWWYFKGRNGTLIPYSEDSKRNNEDLIKPTPRFLMQYVGTDLLRNQLHPEIWVNSLMSEYKSLYGYQTTDSKINIGGISIPIPVLDIDKRVFPNWIITDMRFINELEAVKKRGGITIRVNRPCEICGGSGYHKMSCPVSKSGEHYSETALDSAAFDFVINNNKDIEHLVKEVKKILKKLNII